jgi:two-component SAPR family response regulator
MARKNITREHLNEAVHKKIGLSRDGISEARRACFNEITDCLERGEAVKWPAPGSEDTELGVLMELEVGHGETEV